jgi:hypothetical protein
MIGGVVAAIVLADDRLRADAGQGCEVERCTEHEYCSEQGDATDHR